MPVDNFLSYPQVAGSYPQGGVGGYPQNRLSTGPVIHRTSYPQGWLSTERVVDNSRDGLGFPTMPQLYGAEYRRRRAMLFAGLTTDSVCWRCGEQARSDDPFQAGHIIDGHPGSPLAFEHKSCNLSAGGRLSQYSMMSPASRDWTRS